MVLAFHLTKEVMPRGAIGVDLFFALSGFLITGVLYDELTNTGRIDFRYFYFRRLIRLVPALLVFVLILGPAAAALIGSTSVVGDGLKSMLYVADFAASGVWLAPLNAPYGHTWSLAVEEQFYIVWPPILWLILLSRRSPVLVSFVLGGLGLLTSLMSTILLGVGATYFLPTGHLWALMAGATALFIVRRRERRPPTPKVVATSVTIAWLVIAGLALTHPPSRQFLVLVEYAVCSVAMMTALVFTGDGSLISRVLSSSSLRWFGTRSYGLYLYNVPLLFVFVRPHDSLPRSVNAVLVLLVTMTISEVSYRCVEAPIRRGGIAWWHTRAIR